MVKLYVAANARGTGAAAALLAFGERAIANSGETVAVLYCTAGNTRAQKFYIREGYRLVGSVVPHLNRREMTRARKLKEECRADPQIP